MRSAKQMKRILPVLLLFLISTSAHSQWVQLNTDSVHDYSAIYFLNSDTGFVCGVENYTSGDGIILRTLDGGDSWDTTRLAGTGWLMDIQFLNSNIGFTGGEDGGIYKTTDMGSTWTPFPSCSFPYDFASFYFHNSDTAFVLSFDGQLKIYTPGTIPTCSIIGNVGATGFIPGTGEVSFYSNSIGYVAGGNGKFLKSIDFGNSWQNFNCDSSLYIHDAKMIDFNQIIIVGGTSWTNSNEFGASTVSFDGGVSWSTNNIFSPHNIMATDFYNNNFGICVGGANSIFSTTYSVGSIWSTNDAGMNWMLVDSSYSDQLTDILIVNDSLAFAVGMNGKILRNKALFGSVGIEEVKQESVSIFPNPFSKYIKIVRDEKHQISSISILNSSGMLVSKDTLLSGKQWIVDTSLWSIGVYFLRIVTSERSTIHKIIKIE